jgi:hypothetical protein
MAEITVNGEPVPGTAGNAAVSFGGPGDHAACYAQIARLQRAITGAEAAVRERLAAAVKSRADEMARAAIGALNDGQPGAAQARARADGWAQAAAFIREAR